MDFFKSMIFIQLSNSESTESWKTRSYAPVIAAWVEMCCKESVSTTSPPHTLQHPPLCRFFANANRTLDLKAEQGLQVTVSFLQAGTEFVQMSGQIGLQRGSNLNIVRFRRGQKHFNSQTNFNIHVIG